MCVCVHVPKYYQNAPPPIAQAYVFELDEEYAESDIPTTLIRSKADCPQAEVGR